jgi:hypothetical protein
MNSGSKRMWNTEPRDQRSTSTGVEDNEYGACICQSNILHIGGGGSGVKKGATEKL